MMLSRQKWISTRQWSMLPTSTVQLEEWTDGVEVQPEKKVQWKFVNLTAEADKRRAEWCVGSTSTVVSDVRAVPATSKVQDQCEGTRLTVEAHDAKLRV